MLSAEFKGNLSALTGGALYCKSFTSIPESVSTPLFVCECALGVVTKRVHFSFSFGQRGVSFSPRIHGLKF